MTRGMTLLLLLFAAAFSAEAQDACPCVPVTHLWTVRSCDTYDCAVSAFVLAGSSSDTVVVRTSSTDVRWVVLERVKAGSAISSDPTFSLESFEGFTDASTRFNAVDTNLKPMILSVPDGKFVIVARNAPEPRRRAVSR